MQASCPHCAQNYDVSGELLGKQVQCTTCGKPFNLPVAEGTPSASAPAVAPAPAAPSTPVEVACPHCDSRFHAPPELVGTTANCATCQQPFMVKKAESEFNLAPVEDNLDPFGGLVGGDPLGSAAAGGSPLGNSLSTPSSYSSPSTSSYSSGGDADNSSLWLGIAKILGGVLMGVFGVVATASSYESANEGESYSVYHGLVIGGIALVAYGIRDIYVYSQE